MDQQRVYHLKNEFENLSLNLRKNYGNHNTDQTLHLFYFLF